MINELLGLLAERSLTKRHVQTCRELFVNVIFSPKYLVHFLRLSLSRALKPAFHGTKLDVAQTCSNVQFKG